MTIERSDNLALPRDPSLTHQAKLGQGAILGRGLVLGALQAADAAPTPTSQPAASAEVDKTTELRRELKQLLTDSVLGRVLVTGLFYEGKTFEYASSYVNITNELDLINLRSRGENIERISGVNFRDFRDDKVIDELIDSVAFEGRIDFERVIRALRAAKLQFEKEEPVYRELWRKAPQKPEEAPLSSGSPKVRTALPRSETPRQGPPPGMRVLKPDDPGYVWNRRGPQYGPIDSAGSTPRPTKARPPKGSDPKTGRPWRKLPR